MSAPDPQAVLRRSDEGFGFDATQLGFPSGLVGQLPERIFPRVNMAEYVQLSRGKGENRNYIWSLQPNISLTRGRHNIRAGLDFRSTHVAGRGVGEAGMRFDFNRVFNPAPIPTSWSPRPTTSRSASSASCRGA